jgi:hypothetical protein
MRKLILLACMLPFMSSAQKYPQDYFRNPLNIPILLAGNFGECRGGHFHSGLDIKTGGKENLPVFAAAEGYISRIKMDKGGFGHAIYITHPNGFTTLYAHLNNFTPSVQKYLREQQYRSEKWDLDLQLDASLFPVNKGQQIAFSGNTGSSTAPHLHFEIRDTKTEHPLNPQLFGFDIKDKTAPVPLEIAIYDLRKSIYSQSPKLVGLKKSGVIYQPMNGKIVSGSNVTGIGIHVNDYMDGSENTLNFYKADLWVNDKPVSEIELDDIGYDVTRYLHAYADYKTKEQKNKWIQCLFRLPGNRLEHIYRQEAGDGEISLAEGASAAVRIELTDNNGNTSVVEFILQVENVAADGPQKCNAVFKAGKTNNFDDLNLSFSLPETALYDDVCFVFSADEKANSLGAYKVGDYYIPVHNYFDLDIKPERNIAFDLRDKLAMVYTDGRNANGRAALQGEKGWYSASVRNFGTYSLVVDTVPPIIKPVMKEGSNLSKAGRVSFTIKDAISSVKKYRAELNAKWVVLEQHGNNFFYEFDNRCPKGKNNMVISVSDENGNESTLKYNFTR